MLLRLLDMQHSTRGKLYIFRGVPGSGKSTQAIKFLSQEGGELVEADQWRKPSSYLPYLWSKESDEMAHEWCTLEAERWLRQGVNVAVANTFLKKEYIKYFEDKCGKADKIFRCVGKHNNIHGVSNQKVSEMARSMEDIEDEIWLYEKPHKRASWNGEYWTLGNLFYVPHKIPGEFGSWAWSTKTDEINVICMDPDMDVWGLMVE